MQAGWKAGRNPDIRVLDGSRRRTKIGGLDLMAPTRRASGDKGVARPSSEPRPGPGTGSAPAPSRRSLSSEMNSDEADTADRKLKPSRPPPPPSAGSSAGTANGPAALPVEQVDAELGDADMLAGGL